MGAFKPLKVKGVETELLSVIFVPSSGAGGEFYFRGSCALSWLIVPHLFGFVANHSRAQGRQVIEREEQSISAAQPVRDRGSQLQYPLVLLIRCFDFSGGSARRTP